MRLPEPAQLRVLVVGGDPLSRAGLAALLAGDDFVVVTGTAPSTPDLAEAVAAADPWGLVWDLGPLAETGWEGAELERPTLVLTSDAGHAAAALSDGARGVLKRETDGRRLSAALQAIGAGLVVTDHRASALISRPTAPTAAPVSPREQEVLELLAEGLSNKEIGASLGISEHTARFHVNALLARLGARSRTEAVVLALRSGLLRL